MRNIFYIFTNVISSVSLIFCNKYIFTSGEIIDILFLNTCHMLFNYLTLFCFFYAQNLQLNMQVSFFDRTKFCILSVVCLLLQNVSLTYNTVSRYQILKLLYIPLTIVIFKESVTIKKYLIIFIMSFGIFLSVCGNLEFSVSINSIFSIFSIGIVDIFSFLSVFLSVLTQKHSVYLKTNYQITATQIVYTNSLSVFLFNLLILIVYSFLYKIDIRNYSESSFFFVLLSCFLSVLVNLTSSIVVCDISPLVYQVSGQLKTYLIVLYGFYINNQIEYSPSFVGAIISLVASTMYIFFDG